jgi:AcrR family transcriptional regulator
MVRISKPPEVRRAEILEAAEALFQSCGYEATSVDQIVQATGVAKGTFYYYFRSKKDVLAALASQLVDRMAERSRDVARDPSLGAIAKLQAIVIAQRAEEVTGKGVVEDLHGAENRELHERSNVETVRKFGPILADVIEQGRREGVFHVDDPLSTIQFILAGSLFLFGYGVFDWTPQEHSARQRAMLSLIERALGAAPDSFADVSRDS